MRKIFTAAWVALLACGATCCVQAQRDGKRPAITGIAFARFETTQPAATAHFYRDTLGFDPIAVGESTLYPVNSSQWIEISPTHAARATQRMLAVAFTTRDAGGLETYLRRHGLPIETRWRRGQFSVRDPEGNEVIFVQAGSQAAVAHAAASPRATSRRIIHAGFIVRDAAREDKFWRQTLGFKPYWHGGKTDSSTDYMSLQVPDGTDWLEYMLNIGPSPDLRETGVMDHFSLGVARMQDAVTALARNHCEGENCAKTQMGRDGKVQLNLFDPDLTRVEYMEFVPAEKPCCSPFLGRHPAEEEDK